MEESGRAVSGDADRPIDLAELARRVADLTRRVEGLEWLLAGRPGEAPTAAGPVEPAEAVAREPAAPPEAVAPPDVVAQPPPVGPPPPIPVARPIGFQPAPAPAAPTKAPAEPAPTPFTPEFASPPRAEAPHVAQPPPSVHVAIPAAEKPRRAEAFERRIGISVFNKAGIVALVLAAAFFFKLAVDRGWIGPPVRCLIIAAGGLLLVGLGEWTRRKAWRVVAAGLTAGGIALLYAAAFAASPNYYDLIGTGPAFALMCATTALAVALSLRTNLLTTALMALAGAFLTPVLLSTGRDEQTALMIYLLVVDAGFLAVASLRRWEALVPLAWFGTAALFVAWMAQFYAPERAASTTLFAWALYAAFVVQGLAQRLPMGAPAGVADLIRFLSSIALATVLVICWAGPERETPFMAQLLGLTLVESALLYWRRREDLLGFLWLLVAVAAAAWLGMHYVRESAWATTLWLWLLYGVLMAQTVWLTARRALTEPLGAVLATVGSMVMAIAVIALWADLACHVPLVQVALLVILVLAYAAWQGINWPRPLVCGQVALALLVLYAVGPDAWRAVWVIVPWAWAFGALFLGDVLARSWYRPGAVAYQISLASVTIAAVFGATYGLLKADYDAWMGLYTAGLSAGSLGLAAALHRAKRPRPLVYTFIYHGLVLLTLAIPIQFERHTITIAWAVQAVGSMVLARRLRSRTMLVKGVVVLLLAVLHFEFTGESGDSALARVLVSWSGGEQMRAAFLLALGLSAACYACAGLVRWGRPILGRAADLLLAGALLGLGSLLFFAHSHDHLPALTAGWCWWGLAAAVTAVLAATGARLGLIAGAAHLLVASGRWVAWDTLGRRLSAGAETWRTIVLNSQFVLGVVLAASFVWLIRLMNRRLSFAPLPPGGGTGVMAAWARALVAGTMLLAALLPVWGGSFEVDRYMTGHQGQFADWRLARQMGYSILWAVSAGVMIALGFALRRALLRYLAMVVLAVTVGKVLLVDMAGVGAIYRILSFLALGGVLVAASLIYQRHFGRSERAPAPPDG